MPYSIDDLRIMFGLSSRRAVSDLAKALNLAPERGKFSQAQMKLMYELHTHLASGKILEEFPTIAEVKPLPRETHVMSAEIVSTNNSRSNSVSNPPNNPTNKENPLGELIRAITEATISKRDLLHNYHALEDAVNHQWIISSSNVKELTGASPHGDIFIWANFEFSKIGKVGRESGWRVRNMHH